MPTVRVPIVTPKAFDIVPIVRGSLIPIASIMCISVTVMSENSSVIKAFSSMFIISLNKVTKIEFNDS